VLLAAWTVARPAFVRAREDGAARRDSKIFGTAHEPLAAGEGSMVLWLLIVGVNPERWLEVATKPPRLLPE